MAKTTQLSFNRYFLYFIIVTGIIPTLYFYTNGSYLSYPFITFILILTGYVSFIVGNLVINISSKPVFVGYRLVTDQSRIGSQISLTMVVMLVMVFVFYPLRYKYSIGVPDYPPTIKYAGWIYYLATYGVQAALVAAFFLTKQTIRNFYVLILGLVFYALYEAKLGWRIGLLEAVMILYCCRFFIKGADSAKISNNQGALILVKSTKIMLVLALLYLIYITTISFQMSVRNPGATYVLDQLFLRIWSANYLDNTISYFLDQGYGLFTNGNHFSFLLLNDMSINQFNNEIIVGTLVGSHHGNATSGFGSLYIFGGLLWIVLVYVVAGIYFGFVRNRFVRSRSTFWVTLFLMHFPILFKIINEQFDSGTITTVIALWIFVYIGARFSSMAFFLGRTKFR